MGFLGPEADLIKQMELEQDPRSNVQTPPGRYNTSVPGVFAAGGEERGAGYTEWCYNTLKLFRYFILRRLGKLSLPINDVLLEK